MRRTLLPLTLAVFIAGCSTDADIASNNLSKAAEMFQIERRIVFYNSILDVYLLSIEGRCSLGLTGDKVTVTCRVSDTGYKKHYLGLSDNVTYFAEQLGAAKVGVYHYKVIFKPQAIIPDIDLEGKL